MMEEREALAQSTGWVNINGKIGYLPFAAANFLVGTKKWQFCSSGMWGYILEKREQGGRQTDS